MFVALWPLPGVLRASTIQGHEACYWNAGGMKEDKSHPSLSALEDLRGWGGVQRECRPQNLQGWDSGPQAGSHLWDLTEGEGMGKGQTLPWPAGAFDKKPGSEASSCLRPPLPFTAPVENWAEVFSTADEVISG